MRLGVDVEEVKRFKRFKKSSAFVRRYFSPEEISYCFSKPRPFLHLAARFAAKEAFFKATHSKNGFKEIEVRNASDGTPLLFLQGRRSRAKVSLSHSTHCAFAAVLVP